MFNRKKKQPAPMYVTLNPLEIKPVSEIHANIATQLQQREIDIEKEADRKKQYDERVWKTLTAFAIIEGLRMNKLGVTIAIARCKCPSDLLYELRDKGYHYNYSDPEINYDQSQPNRLDIHWTINAGVLEYNEVYFVDGIADYEKYAGVKFDDYGHIQKRIN